MIEVDRHGAFGVNSVGLERVPFPLTFSVREVEGSWEVTAAAAQGSELLDLLLRSSREEVVVANLATNSFMDEDYRSWTPSEIAADQGAACRVHPIGDWAAGAIELGEELLVLDRSVMPRFLDGSWSPYELTLVDVEPGLGAGQLDELALAIGTARAREPMLPRLPGSRLYFSGHDDCYVLVETRDADLPALLFGRLLALMAGSALHGVRGTPPGPDGPTVGVPEPDRALAERLIGRNPHWIGTVTQASEDGVHIALGALERSWRLGERPERTDCTAVLDLGTGAWRLADGESAG
ncbi:hypothetical protein ACIA8O_02290 [Kitasatospora sp. NPDC051853]|uniref:hypothetical protein n=1 Tax=Kitasatospora sp. NPDC051853 TaxID=3364058 RepID=UPI0037B3F923